MKRTSDIIRPFLGLLAAWPRERRCFGCSSVYAPESGEAGVLLCPSCLADMPRRERGYCPACGEPAAWPELPLAPCARCSEEPPSWDGFLFHGLYEGRLRKMLLDLKFYNGIQYGHVLGGLLAEHPALQRTEADSVVPVPLHTARLAHRGYNQALEIARPIAARLGLPLRTDFIARARATAPQSGSSLEQRQENIRDAFACGKSLRGRRLLLVDDTFTTGATLESACKALRRAEAETITVAVVSRTPRYQNILRIR